MTVKDILRTELKHVLRAMSVEDIQLRSREIEAQLLQYLATLDHDSNLSVVGLYLPLRNEPHWDWRRWKAFPWKLAFPAQTTDGMEFQLAQAELPTKGHWVTDGKPCEPDVLVVPGLGFSADGYRLGRGGGFYDKLLATWRPSKGCVGVCFETQLREHLAVEAHDMKMNVIITDSRVISCNS